MGKFIAIEGLDGAGKSTQIGLLMEHFEKEGIKTQFIHFPRTGKGVFGELIAKFLRGEYGAVKDVHPQLVALLFAEDRKDFSAIMKGWLREKHVVLVDRYVLSNIAFQCAKLENAQEKEALKEWILTFEYEYNKIPKPDLSLYLDVPFKFTTQSLGEKRTGSERNYLQGKEDIHEKDMALQQAVKEEYEKMASTDPSVYRITCYNEQGMMKPVEDIHNTILKTLELKSKSKSK